MGRVVSQLPVPPREQIQVRNPRRRRRRRRRHGQVVRDLLLLSRAEPSLEASPAAVEVGADAGAESKIADGTDFSSSSFSYFVCFRFLSPMNPGSILRLPLPFPNESWFNSSSYGLICHFSHRSVRRHRAATRPTPPRGQSTDSAVRLLCFLSRY